MRLPLFPIFCLAGKLSAAAGLSFVTDTGTGASTAQYAAADVNGNTYVAGTTLQTTANHYLGIRGGTDIRVTKLNALGQPVWSTLVGTNKDDTAAGVAADASGNVYVLFTSSCSTVLVACTSWAATRPSLLSIANDGSALRYNADLATVGLTALLSVDRDGTSYTANYSGPILHLRRIQSSGAVTYLQADAPSADLQAFAGGPSGFWLYFRSINRLSKFNPAGTLFTSVTPGSAVSNSRIVVPPGNSGVSYLSGIRPDGSLLLEKRDVNMVLLRQTAFGAGVQNLDGLAVNDDGEIYLMGQTNSPSYPRVNAFADPTGKLIDTFVTRFTPQFVADLSSFVPVSRPTSAAAYRAGVSFSINGSHAGGISAFTGDLSITVGCGTPSGSTSTCAAEVRNLGPETSKAARLTAAVFLLPTQNFTITTTQGNCVVQNFVIPSGSKSVNCWLSDIPSGAAVKVSIRPDTIATGTSITWSALALTGTDPNTANNTVTAQYR